MIRTETPVSGVTEIVLNRPEKCNAINQQMRQELKDAIANVNTGVVLLRGSSQTFCSGEDVDELSSPDAMSSHTQELVETLHALQKADAVTIACIEGYALGGGMFLAAACDLRIAIEGADFGVPVLNLGIPPAGGGTKILIDLLGIGEVRKLVFTADIVNHEYAADVGFVQWVCPNVETARSIAGLIADHDTEALQTAKAYINACSAAESLQEVRDFEETFITNTTPDLPGREHNE